MIKLLYALRTFGIFFNYVNRSITREVHPYIHTNVIGTCNQFRIDDYVTTFESVAKGLCGERANAFISMCMYVNNINIFVKFEKRKFFTHRTPNATNTHEMSGANVAKHAKNSVFISLKPINKMCIFYKIS